MEPRMSHKQHEWTYDDRDKQCGPRQWSKHFATGDHQSPINILVDAQCASYQAVTCCAGRLKERLHIITNDRRNHDGAPGSARRHQEQAAIYRTHLDSIGEDTTNASQEACNDSFDNNNFGSPSTTSSSNRSSPTQASSSDYFDDDDDVEEEEEEDDFNDDGYSGQNNNNNKKSNSSNNLRKHCSRQQQKQLARMRQNTRFCISNKKLFLGYPRYLNSMELQNTGHSWQVSLPPELSTHTLISGPPLANREYRLAQFHCHWGDDCDNGSEHQINGKSYSAEIHFVHWNCSDYKTIEEASKHKHGLAVLGVLVQAVEGEQNRNKHLDKIILGLGKIHKPGSKVTISQSRLDLKKLFPTNRWFYASYEGSLTTPPLSEVVDWIVFLNPIQCCTSQIEQFRQIRCANSKGEQTLIKNCRPVQPSNNRLVSIWSHH